MLKTPASKLSEGQAAMRNAPIAWWLILLIAVSPLAHSTHVCTNSPDEVFVGMSPPSNGIAAMPLCQWRAQAASPEPAPPPVVVDRFEWYSVGFNAIAICPVTGAHGASGGASNGVEATNRALHLCQRDGGTHCEIAGGTRNGCVTLVAPPRPLINPWVLEGTVDQRREIERKTVERCKAAVGQGARCKVVETVCDASRPLGMRLGRQPGVTYAPTR